MGIIAYGYRFFTKFFYVLDFFIIAISLGFDLFLNTSEAGLMVLLLSWRVLRIVHGLYTSFELHHGAAHKAADQAKTETLERVGSVKDKQHTGQVMSKTSRNEAPDSSRAVSSRAV